MANNRGYEQPWELRLSALQMVVWSGLAVGAMVGSYFLGFFYGRFVGFETARASSGVEVAKLALSAEVPDRAESSVSAIYDKLNAPALLDQRPAPPVQPQPGRAPAEPPIGVQAAQALKSSDSMRARAVDGGADSRASGAKLSDGAPASVRSSPPKGADGRAVAAEGAQAAAEIDSLFDENDSHAGVAESGEADSFRDASGTSGSVRMLGDGAAKTDTSSGDKTLGAILEERLARARADGDKGVLHQAPPTALDSSAMPSTNVGDPLPSSKRDTSASASNSVRDVPSVKLGAPKEQAKSAAESSSGNASDSASTRSEQVAPQKSVPGGYFAQVAAPKRMSDAQEVAKKLKRSGFPVVIESANVRGEEFYRVLVGPEENKVQADRLIGQLQRERYLSGAPFIKHIK